MAGYIVYEWDVEWVDENGDIEEHMHQSSFSDCLKEADSPEEGMTKRIVLVRDSDKGRSWAYLRNDGTLPHHFLDASDKPVARIPIRFSKEVSLLEESDLFLKLFPR